MFGVVAAVILSRYTELIRLLVLPGEVEGHVFGSSVMSSQSTVPSQIHDFGRHSTRGLQ